MSRDLNKATPRMREFAEKLIKKAKELLNIDVLVVEVDRSYDVQVAYYAQGRDTLDAVNKLRKRAGLSPITEKENKKKITWTMDSRHIINLTNDDKSDDLSRAIDFGIKDKMGKYDGSSKVDTNKDNIGDYYQLGALAKTIDRSIEWGGDWENKDLPHFQESRKIFEGGMSGGGGVSRDFSQPITEKDLDNVTAFDNQLVIEEVMKK